MAKDRIPWSNDKEIEMLKQLVNEGLDFEDVTKTLNKEFRSERPINHDTGNKLKRSRDSVYWFYQRLVKKEKGGDDSPTPRRKRIQTSNELKEDLDINEGQHVVLVKNSVGKTVCMFTTEKGVDEIMASMKDLF